MSVNVKTESEVRNMGRIDKWCPMCGAAPGEPCTVISGDDGLNPGDERPTVHFYRNNDAKPVVLVPDEPGWTAAAPDA